MRPISYKFIEYLINFQKFNLKLFLIIFIIIIKNYKYFWVFWQQ
jgi:hypothetical protein